MSPPAYSAAFEAFWQPSDKLGSKSDALKAWRQVGEPAADGLLASRRAWLESWNGIGVKHIATWLRDFDWQQEPASRSAPRPAGPPARNFREEATAAAFETFRAMKQTIRGG